MANFLLVHSVYDNVSAINIICVWRLADGVFCTLPESLLLLFLVLTDTPGYLNILMQRVSDGRDGFLFINAVRPPVFAVSVIRGLLRPEKK